MPSNVVLEVEAQRAVREAIERMAAMGAKQQTRKWPADDRNGGKGPTTVRIVDSRWDASPNPGMLRVFAEVVSTDYVALPGARSQEGGELQTRLSLLAWVGGGSVDKSVWADVYVLNRDGEVLRIAAFGFCYVEPADEGGDYFMLDEIVHRQPAVLPSGGSGPSESPIQLKYRLYCRVGDQIWTDDILHRWGNHRVGAAALR